MDSDSNLKVMFTNLMGSIEFNMIIHVNEKVISEIDKMFCKSLQIKKKHIKIL